MSRCSISALWDFLWHLHRWNWHFLWPTGKGFSTALLWILRLSSVAHFQSIMLNGSFTRGASVRLDWRWDLNPYLLRAWVIAFIWSCSYFCMFFTSVFTISDQLIFWNGMRPCCDAGFELSATPDSAGVVTGASSTTLAICVACVVDVFFFRLSV